MSRDTVGLAAGVSTVMLGIMALAPSPGWAFDTVNWTWEATVTETVNKTVTIVIDADPSGMVMLEDLQVSIGDVTATSSVTGIHNHQPSGGGSAVVDLGTLTLNGQYGLGGAFLPGMTAEGDVVQGAVVSSGSVDEGDVGPPGTQNLVEAVIDLGSITVDITGDPLDALTELPEVVSEATAVANNTSVTADTAIQLHEAQWAVADTDALSGEEVDWNALASASPAVISATSSVSDILNASVDSSATAVANNLTVDASAAVAGDRVLIADILQVSVADVTASSSVYDVTVSNYTNLGAIGRPLASSVATAVGNNKSISVGGTDGE